MAAMRLYANCVEQTGRNEFSMTKIIVTSLLVFSLAGCAPASLKDEFKSINAYYETHDAPDFQFSQDGTLNLRYLETGDKSKTTVVFIHGTPGSWSAFAGYVNEPTLQKQAHLVVIDRPGWGGSTLSDDNFRPGIEAQSALLKDWLCDLSAHSGTGRLILVGHSLGGTLAPRLAMDHPDCVTAMLILAGPMDPDLATPRWYNQVARVPPFGWLADKFMGGGMRQSNKEMLVLKSELEKMRPLWVNINIPVTIIQGGKDTLVNAKHADFAEDMMSAATLKIIRLPDTDHFFVFSDKALVIGHLRDLLELAGPLQTGGPGMQGDL